MAILITGGTKGIGLSVALSFAATAGDVFLNYHGDDEAAAAAKAAVEAAGARVHLIRADVGTLEGCAEIARQIRAVGGDLHQIVHCAVDAYSSPVLSADPIRFTKAVTTNSTSLLLLVQALLDLLPQGATIFFFSSRGGKIVVPNYAAIGLGKAATESLIRYMAVELAPMGIRINAIAPSIVETDAVREVFGTDTAKIMAESAKSNPSGRVVRPEDYTSLMHYLASPAASFITGQIVYVNGGANLSA